MSFIIPSENIKVREVIKRFHVFRYTCSYKKCRITLIFFLPFVILKLGI